MLIVNSLKTLRSLCQKRHRLLSTIGNYYTLACCSVSLFRFRWNAFSFFCLCCSKTHFLTISPLFPSHSHTYAGLILYPFALPYKHTLHLSSHCSWIHALLSNPLSLPQSLRLIFYPFVTCWSFSASLFRLYSPFIPCGCVLACSSGFVHMLACCDLDSSLCWIVEKTKFVRNENHFSGLPVSKEMTRICAFFLLLLAFSESETLAVSEFHATH